MRIVIAYVLNGAAVVLMWAVGHCLYWSQRLETAEKRLEVVR